MRDLCPGIDRLDGTGTLDGVEALRPSRSRVA